MPPKRTIALLGAVVCALVAAVTWALAFRTGLGQAADARLLGDLTLLKDTRLRPFAIAIGALCNPLPYATLSAAVCALALGLRGLRMAAIVGAVLLVPNVVTQVLKRELAEPRMPVPGGPTVDPVSWPSGHSTAAAALALAVLFIAPIGWRALVGLAGAAFAGAMAASVVILGWHFPSDALGGVAIAGAGACVAAAVVSRPAATTVPQNRWHRATG